MTKTESKFKKYSQSLLRYLIELLIVFAGVYGAFLLSEYKENRQKDERKNQIYGALLREISSVSTDAQHIGTELSKYKAIYDSLIAERKMPRLGSFTNPILFTPHVWEATIQSDGLSLLEVSTIEKLSEFYGYTQHLVTLIEEFRGRTESFILFNYDKDKYEFYDLKTKQLRPKYSWYLQGLGQMAGECDRIHRAGRSLSGRAFDSGRHTRWGVVRQHVWPARYLRKVGGGRKACAPRGGSSQSDPYPGDARAIAPR